MTSILPITLDIVQPTLWKTNIELKSHQKCRLGRLFLPFPRGDVQVPSNILKGVYYAMPCLGCCSLFSKGMVNEHRYEAWPCFLYHETCGIPICFVQFEFTRYRYHLDHLRTQVGENR